MTAGPDGTDAVAVDGPPGRWARSRCGPGPTAGGGSWWTYRVRIGLLCAVLVVLAGGCLLGATLLSVDRAIATEQIDPVGSQLRLLGGIDPDTGHPVSADRAAELKRQYTEDERQLREGLRSGTLGPVMHDALLLGGAFVLAAVGIGWLVAARAARPVRGISRAARRATARGSGLEPGPSGPPDELRDLAETVDDLLGRLDSAMDGQWRFVANASHELKTPLAINRTLLEVALARPDVPTELVQLGTTLLEVNARHERLIDGLLTLARSDRASIRPVPVDLAAVARRVGDLIGAEAVRARVEVRSELAPADVLGDPLLLERLVLNLAQNAVRHNHPGGWARIITQTTADRVTVTVENTGAELADYEVPWLFEPFRRQADRGAARPDAGRPGPAPVPDGRWPGDEPVSRTSPATGEKGPSGSGPAARGSSGAGGPASGSSGSSTSGPVRVVTPPGSGLGLSIVRSVARAHGGEVVARPRLGGGLVVQVVLPARTTDAEGLGGTR